MTARRRFLLLIALLVILAALIASGHERIAYALVALECVLVGVAGMRR